MRGISEHVGQRIQLAGLLSLLYRRAATPRLGTWEVHQRSIQRSIGGTRLQRTSCQRQTAAPLGHGPDQALYGNVSPRQAEGRRFATSPPDYGTLGDRSITVRGGSRESERLHVPPVLPPARPLYVRNYPYTAHYSGTE
jgi:hypothetical protein